MKRARVLLGLAVEIGFDAPHLTDHPSRMFRQAESHRCRRKLPPGANKQFRLQMIGEALELEADSSRRKMDPLGSLGYTARFQDSQKHLELMDIHPRLCLIRNKVMAATV